MKALLILALSALPNAPVDVRVTTNAPAECGPAPELPAVTELWAVQDPSDDTLWINYVTAWVPDAYPSCWKLGREVFKGYANDADTPGVHEPTDVGDISYD